MAESRREVKGTNRARGKDMRAAGSRRDVLVCALGKERVLLLGTQVNAQQSDTFCVCANYWMSMSMSILSQKSCLQDWGDGPVGKVLAVQT